MMSINLRVMAMVPSDLRDKGNFLFAGLGGVVRGDHQKDQHEIEDRFAH